MDASREAILGRALALSVDVERDFAAVNKGPVAHLLAAAFTAAIAAANALTTVDPENPGEIRKLQAEVARFLDMRDWIADVVESGNEAWEDLKPEEQAAILTDISGEVNDA